MLLKDGINYSIDIEKAKILNDSFIRQKFQN